MIHILQSCIEEEEEDDDVGSLQEMPPDDDSLVRPDQAPFHPPESPPSQEHRSPSVDPPHAVLTHMTQSWCPAGMSGVVLGVLGFLVDTATGEKVQIPGAQLLQFFKGNKNYQVVMKPTKTPLFKQRYRILESSFL